MNAPRISGFLPALLALAVFAVAATPVHAAQSTCRWDGSGPVCAGKCAAHEDQLMRESGDRLPALGLSVIGGTPDFGSHCAISGSKALCCTKCPPGLVRRDEGADWDKKFPTPCLTPGQKAAFKQGHHVERADNCDAAAKDQVGWAKKAKELKCALSGDGWSTDAKVLAVRCKSMSEKDWTNESLRRWGELGRCAQTVANQKKEPAEKQPPQYAPDPNKTIGRAVITGGDVDIWEREHAQGRKLGIFRKDAIIFASCSTPSKTWCKVFHLKGAALTPPASEKDDGYVWHEFVQFESEVTPGGTKPIRIPKR